MSKVESLRQHLLRLYREHLADGMMPTSARFLFYELIALGLILKRASGVLRPGADEVAADQGFSDLRRGEKRGDRDGIRYVYFETSRKRQRVPHAPRRTARSRTPAAASG